MFFEKIKNLLKRLVVYLLVFSRVIRNKKDGAMGIDLAGVIPSDFKSSIIHGGKVKLLHLIENFKVNSRSFNILYLVSSGLPSFVDIWIKIYKKFGIKIVWNQNGVAYPGWAKDNYLRINNLFAPIHKADFVVYQSIFCKKSADKYVGKFNGPNDIVYNCVDSEKFVPGDNRNKQNQFILLAVGTHNKKERVMVPIETLNILVKKGFNFKLKIAGRILWPNAQEEINNKIKEYNLEKFVDISGPYTQEEAPTIFNKCHILLHVKYLDPCPTAVIEAMSCGLAVIGSRSGGMPELVRDNSGILIDVPEYWDKLVYPDPKLMADAVIEIHKKWDFFSLNARNNVLENFDKKNWIKKHEIIFNNLISK